MTDEFAGQVASGRLVLRPPRAEDRQRWFELFRDPDELRYGLPSFVTPPAFVAELDKRVEVAQQSWRNREPGTLVIAALDDDRFVGTVAWRLDAPPMQVADIGYAVHPDSRGHGIATDAVRTLTRWLTVDPTGPILPRVQLDHSVENLASCRTALAAGFAQEGVRSRYLPLRDESAPGGERRHDVCLHGFVPRGE